mgnify:FL=1
MTLWTLACEITFESPVEVRQCVTEILDRLGLSSVEDQADTPQTEG